MKKRLFQKKNLRDGIITLGMLCLFFLSSWLLYYVLSAHELVPAAAVLFVFLTAFLTEGYLWGILLAAINMLTVNFAFTAPFFKFNFTIPENLISAIILISVTLLTSTLTTKLKRAEAERMEGERERMRANLLRAVSHDLRTPLTTIYGSATGILDNYDILSEEQKREMLSGITEDAEWLTRMVENLLSVTKLDGDMVKIQKSPTVLEELIDSVLSKFHKRYPRETVTVDIPEDFVIIPMDALLIEQVLVNMLDNAVQHASGHTEICLSVRTEGGKAVFEVADDGSGTDEATLRDIFSGRLQKSDTKSVGMGIGLSVCATIIRAHDGEISAHPREPHGVVFRFVLDTGDNSMEEYE